MRSGRIRDIKVGAENERDLRLDLGLQQAVEGDGGRAADMHVVEQHTEIRLVYPELSLHRRGRESDLTADSSGPLVESGPGQEGLHCVSDGHAVDDLPAAQTVPDRRARNTGASRSPQRHRGRSDSGSGGRHVARWRRPRHAGVFTLVGGLRNTALAVSTV